MKLTVAILSILVAVPGLAQQKSAKRGIGWDEKSQRVSEAAVSKMLPGISWLYNWGPAPNGTADNLGTTEGMLFVPMCWNGAFNETTIRNYVDTHSGVKYLLGFNEPNFSAQANMTPEAAATLWPKVEKIAADCGLTLVAPALNFTGEKVGGRIWNPYEWLDEFIRQYEVQFGTLPVMDCLALHCYMNWYSSNTWFATEYFYSDLYNVSKTDVYGRYPNIVKYLDAYKAAHGHFPRMMLTEFCSWENDGTITGVDFQIDQMTQKVQKLEQSDLVEGYAWFMANGTASSYPYFSIFTNASAASLSTLGTVYTYMSSFDTDKYYVSGEIIDAKDYVDASTDEQQVRLRPNTESGSTHPLQVEMQCGSWTKYQLSVPTDSEYRFVIRMCSTTDSPLWLYVDGKKGVTPMLASTAGQWADRDFTTTLPAGEHSIMLYNGGTTPFLISSLRFYATASSIAQTTATGVNDKVEVYDMGGIHIATASALSELNLAKGIYIVIMPSGEKKKITY